MAGRPVSDSDDEFHSLSLPDRDREDDGQDLDADSSSMDPPVHPIASFQGAFEESISEAAAMHDYDSASEYLEGNAEVRRRRLLRAKRYEDFAATRWKQRPDAKFHPLLKLMAQIVFGMHLLQQQQAKSNEEVVKILQNHVNEVDSFLERTSEDFDLAIKDIEERIRYLKLPMQHMHVFETMLDDKSFRTDLLNGNDKIEKIIRRSAKAMNDALFDVQGGVTSTKELATYLDSVENEWPRDESDIFDVYLAMRGNEQGWSRYLGDLQLKGNNLSNDLVTLSNLIGDISKLAAAASRRNKIQSKTVSPPRDRRSNPSSPTLRSKFAKEPTVSRDSQPWLDKPLPSEPPTSGAAVQVALVKPHPVPFATRYEQPRESAPVPQSHRSPSSEKRAASPLRPKTAGEGRPHQSRPRDSMRELADFLKHSGPLRSHPPETAETSAGHIRKPVKQRGQVTEDVSKNIPKKQGAKELQRSKSQGDIAHASRSRRSAARKAAEPLLSRSGTQINWIPHAGQEKKEPAPVSNGLFTRRVSTKLRKERPLPKVQRERDPVPKPVDSAYSSDRKRSTSSPTNFTEDTDKEHFEHEKDSSFDPEKERRPATTESNRKGQRLGLFPKDSGPLTPSQASMYSKEHGVDGQALGRVESTPTTKQPAKTPHIGTIRRLFHRRGDRSVTA